MSTPSTIAILTILLASMTAKVKAEIPQTPNFKDYAHILDRSPFIIKINEMVKPVNKPKAQVDYYLRGVTKLESGWMIILADRKKPKLNIILKQGQKHSSDIELIDVLQNKDNYKLTEAKLKFKAEKLTVGYSPTELQKNSQIPSVANKGSKKIFKTPTPAVTPTSNRAPTKPTQKQDDINKVKNTEKLPIKGKDPKTETNPDEPAKRVRPTFPTSNIKP